MRRAPRSDEPGDGIWRRVRDLVWPPATEDEACGPNSGQACLERALKRRPGWF